MIAAVGLHLLQSTMFAAVICAVAMSVRRLGPSARHALWFAAATKFALPLSLFSWLGIQAQSILPGPDSAVLPQGLVEFLASSEPIATSPGPSSPLNAMTVVWAIGVLLMMLRLIRGWLRLGPTLEYPSEQEQEVVERLRKLLRISRTVRLRASASGSSELGLGGLWRPTIKIPRGLSSKLAPSELEAVLLHELAHVRRWDNLAAAFVHTLVCLFWFHPLLWWLERQLLAERERACDELVISHGIEPETYVAGILKVCRFQFFDAVAGTSNIGGSDLKNRMELIMSYPSSNPTTGTWRLSGILATAMTIVPFLGGFLQQSAVHAQQAADNSQSKNACMYDSKEYPQGTVLQMGRRQGAPKRLCAEGRWTETGAVTKVVEDVRRIGVRYKVTPSPQGGVCKPAPSKSPNECACQDGAYSLGAIVNTDSEKMRCDKFVLGQYSAWRPATASELGSKQGASIF